MHSTHFKKLLIPILALITILACSPFAAATPQPAATLNALYTAAAQTLEGMSTQAAIATQLSVTPTLSLSVPTSSPIATFTTVPPLSPVPVSRCDSAAFVTDVTYPDGSLVPLGGAFTKIWRLQNTGTCTWTTSYALVYVTGERFSAPAAVTMPTNVGPGQTVDLAVNLTAPNQNGQYRGFWKLRNSANVLFGIGPSADSNFYVDVKVTGYTVTGYDFLANYCDANWQNSSRDLPCPGSEGDDNGFVIVLNSPKMEDGQTRGNGLLTYPEKGNDGLISGKYPAFKIQSGDRFQALIGCLNEANDCDMIYRLQYQIGNGSVRTLGQWREVYEGDSYPINIDLSTLSGEKVKFILLVLANGTSHEDFALWINPRISRQSSEPPTATSTSGPQVVTATFTATGTATTTPTATATATSTATSTSTATATATP
jgi:Ig-like domain-containing protein